MFGFQRNKIKQGVRTSAILPPNGSIGCPFSGGYRPERAFSKSKRMVSAYPAINYIISFVHILESPVLF